MKNQKIRISYFLISLVCGFLLFYSCKQKPKSQKTEKGVSLISIDSTKISPFIDEFNQLEKYKTDYTKIYNHYDFHYIWFDEEGMVDYAESLYNQVQDLNKEGIFTSFPYQKEIDTIFNKEIKDPDEFQEAEFLMTGLYLFYLNHVYKGIDSQITKDLGWLLPRKDVDDIVLLDSVISGEEWERNDSLMVDQYFKMRDKLEEYRKIQQEGEWEKIEFSSKKKSFKPNDSSEVILQIRNRLYQSGDLKNNNHSEVYDKELQQAMAKFQKYHGFKTDSIISAEHIAALNVPVSDYITKIVVNLERMRWIPPKVNQAKEFIFVNIPAYHLDYYRKGEVIFESDIIVGNVMTKTVIFDGEMSYLAFSPYWNIPQSIIEKEIKPGMEKDEDYLKKRNMEWNDGRVRQLPGGNNSLGLVKFMFPNSNDIYLHDTPAKYLFQNEERALSHGCIRVAKARDLAITILEDDEEWTPEKIDKAMHAGRERTYNLKNKIPVYIGYFTAWVDEDNEISFFKDIYKRDEKLADLLFAK